MACSVSHPFLCLYSPIHQNRSCVISPISSLRKTSPSYSTARLRSIPKSSPQKNPITTENDSKIEPESKDENNSDLFFVPSLLNSFSRILGRLRSYSHFRSSRSIVTVLDSYKILFDVFHWSIKGIDNVHNI